MTAVIYTLTIAFTGLLTGILLAICTLIGEVRRIKALIEQDFWDRQGERHDLSTESKERTT